MPDITAISAALASFKVAKDIAQAMIGLRDAAAFRSKMIEFQSAILDAQSAAFSANEERTALIAQIEALKKRIAEIEAWEAEKQRYELQEIAPRMFVYVLKPETKGTEPSHWICPSCYQKCQKAILQGFHSATFGWSHTCPACKLEIRA